MNVLELLMGQLNQEKNLLEVELERVVNNKDLSVISRVEMSKKLLTDITNIMTIMNVTSGYLTPQKNVGENNKK